MKIFLISNQLTLLFCSSTGTLFGKKNCLNLEIMDIST
ncbi:hypothetical protein HMPREF1109_0397 [Streptococcus intermedius SK54 = ATCC 27335]|nr:hypothetical protein HMPREF1109_0397 [Streptococcus intermedius SK54 = ATCC 27335]